MYYSQDVAKKIKIQAKEKKVSVKQLLLDIGLGFNTMSNMKTSMPKADNLAKIADYLDCSVDYLLGRTETIELTDLSEEFISATIKQFPDKFKEFILKDMIIQHHKEITKEYYFVRDIHYGQIMEIYEVAHKYDGNNIIDKQEYENLFEYFKLPLTNFGARYIVTPTNYDKFLSVYNLYIKSFTSKIFISFRYN